MVASDGAPANELSRPSHVVAGLAIAATAALQARMVWHYFAGAPIGTDDEGYLTMVVRSWARGGALYTDVFSQYGPFPTVLHGLPLRLGDLSLSLSTGRAVSAATTLLAMALVAASTWAATRRLLLALASQLAVGIVLLPDTGLSHSMHPGVLLSTVLGLALLNVVALRPRWPRASDALSGALAAAALLTKLNVGLLLLAAHALAGVVLLTTMRRSARLPALRVVTEVAFVAMGPVLLLSQAEVMRSGWVRLFPHNRVSTLIAWSACFAVGAASLVLAARRALAPLGGDRAGTGDPAAGDPRRSRSVAPSAAAFVAGAAACGALVLGVVLATGSSAIDVVDNVLLRPAGQVRALAILPPVGLRTLGWSALSTGILVVALLVGRDGAPRARVVAAAAGARMAAAVLLAWALVEDRVGVDGGILGLLPLAALVVVAPDGAASPADRPTRLFVAALAVGQTLHAYPVAGAQVAWASFLLVPVVALLLADATDQLRPAVGDWRPIARTSAVVGPAMLFLIAMVLRTADVAATARTDHDAAVVVEATADRRLRLPAAEAEWFRWLDGALDGCAAVFTSPGMSSVHVVLGTEPITGYNTTMWTELLDDAEQQAIVDGMRASGGPVCIVSAEAAFAELFEVAGMTRDQPLERFLDDADSLVTDQLGIWQVLRIEDP